MMAGFLPPQVAKEVRALLPAWLASVVVMSAAAAVRDDGTLRALGELAFPFGAAVLGALSIGHEYMYGTLPSLLCQPSGRKRIFVVKFAVLVTMLLILSAVAWVTVLSASNVSAILVVLAVLGGLCIAPLLTMVTRNPLAGALFTIVVAGISWLPVDVFVTPRLKLVVFSRLLLGFCAIAAVLGWGTFMRLEAVEGRGADVRLPARAARVAPARDRHPMWLLAKKEIGLQQLTLAIAAGYLALWLATWLLFKIFSPPDWMDPLAGTTLFYSVLLALLIGSLASAEERQLGTLDWQVLLPMAMWKQWVVKVGTALGLAVALSFAVPAALIYLAGAHFRMGAWGVAAILVLTSASLYVSSLSANGLKAFLLSASIPVATIVLLSRFAPSVFIPHRIAVLPLAVLPLAGFLALVLWFALLNHRSGERGVWRIGQQVFVMAGCAAFGAAIFSLISAFR